MVECKINFILVINVCLLFTIVMPHALDGDAKI